MQKVIEQQGKENLQEVKVEIYSQESAFIEPHFSAVFEVAKIVSVKMQNDYERLIENVLEIIPQEICMVQFCFKERVFSV